MRAQTLIKLQGYQSLTSEHFELFYTAKDSKVANMVLSTAEKLYAPVVGRVGFKPDGQVPLIMYASRSEMRSAFGWGNGESAMGVYWQGTIRLLSPNVWASDLSTKDQKKAFEKLNPIAHELTHYVLDYMTDGNYPRWFTEGLAQYVEYEATGYLWIEDASSLDQHLYTLEDLQGRFDQLTNQPLAYRECFLLTDYMVRTYGQEGLNELIYQLKAGVPFPTALQEVFDVSPDQLYQSWHSWVEQHLDELDGDH